MSLKIIKNIKSLTKRLTIPLKDNEKSLVEKDVDDDLNENNDENNDENIQSILEKLEQDIDNKFEILY